MAFLEQTYTRGCEKAPGRKETQMKQIAIVAKMWIIINSTFAGGFNEEEKTSICFFFAKWHTHILVDIIMPRLKTD